MYLEVLLKGADMGNRAVITSVNKDLGIYLHWNGGIDSVTAFLEYCKLRGFRSPETDSYGYARLCQVLGNFFGADGLSVGVSPYINDRCSDPGDNGIYVIKDWRIVDRLGNFHGGHEGYDLDDMLRRIDMAQPTSQQLGSYLYADTARTRDLSVGDKVYMQKFDGTYSKHTVVGIAEAGTVVNGTDVSGLPYVDLFGSESEGYGWNINNYIRDATVRIAERAREDGGCDLDVERDAAREASEGLEREDAPGHDELGGDER